MRWPWQQKPENREAGGDYSQMILSLAEQQAHGTAADLGKVAALEAVSGLLSRSLMSAQVEGTDLIAPPLLAQIGRDLIRKGESLTAIRMNAMGDLKLITCADWDWHGSQQSVDPEEWMVRATSYGPSASITWKLPASAVIFLRWGSNAGSLYRGQSPVQWASQIARLEAEAEKSLGDELSGPVTNLLPIPQDGGSESLVGIKTAIARAKGQATLLESTSAGWGEGPANAPRKDWIPSRLAPAPNPVQLGILKESFAQVCAACGCPPALFEAGADGTSQRESLRRWHLGTVMPLVKMIEHELSSKLATQIKLHLDSYPKDMVSRSTVFSKIGSVEGISTTQALQIAGLLDD